MLLSYIYGATKRNRQKSDEFAALYSYRLSLSQHTFPSDFYEYVHIVKLLFLKRETLLLEVLCFAL